MKTLELNNILPYLSYKLYCQTESDSGNKDTWLITGFENGAVHLKGSPYKCDISDIKPLLVPLSELPNFRDEYQSVFYPCISGGKTPKHQMDLWITILSDRNVRNHAEADWMAYNHFDLFGLIDAGLALNKLHHLKSV